MRCGCPFEFLGLPEDKPLMESDLEYQFREEFDKTLEFTAIHVFLLGLRTGAGLGALIPQGTAPSAPGPSACTPP